MVITAIIIWFAFIALMVWFNYVLIVKKNIVPNHPINAIITITCAIIFANYLNSWQMIFVLLWIYWLLFDIGLNKSRKLHLNYLGHKSILDRLLRKVSYGQPILFKILLAVISYGIYEAIV